jgi:hypothetical protein
MPFAIYSGNGQVVGRNGSSPEKLRAILTTGGGAPIAGQTVTWALASGVGDPYPVTSVTNASGIAETTYRGGGTYSVTALEKFRTSVVRVSTAGEADVDFYATTVNNPMGGADQMPTASLTDPIGSTHLIVGQAGQTLVGYVTVLVGFYTGNTLTTPVPYVGLELYSVADPALQATASGGAGGSVLSDASGVAALDVTFGAVVGAGSAVLKIGLTSYVQLELCYWNMFLLARTLALPQIQYYDLPAAAMVGTQLLSSSIVPGTPPITVRVFDGAGAPAAGTAVLWESVTPGAMEFTDSDAVTDADGYASTGVLLGLNPGVFNLKVTALATELLLGITILSSAAAGSGGGGGSESILQGSQTPDATFTLPAAGAVKKSSRPHSAVVRTSGKGLDTSLLLPFGTDLTTPEGLRTVNERFDQIERVLRTPPQYDVSLPAKFGYGSLAALGATFQPVPGAKVSLDKPGNWQITATFDWAGSGTAEGCVVIDPEKEETAKRQDAVCKKTNPGTTTAWCLFTATTAPRLAQLYAKGSGSLAEAGTSICAIWLGAWVPGDKRFGRQIESQFVNATDMNGDALTDHGDEAHYPREDHPYVLPEGVDLPDL